MAGVTDAAEAGADLTLGVVFSCAEGRKRRAREPGIGGGSASIDRFAGLVGRASDFFCLVRRPAGSISDLKMTNDVNIISDVFN